jgi:hypothetical protein
MRVFLGTLTLATALVMVIGSALSAGGGQDPKFSFWGNLPGAYRLLEPLPAELRFEPVPLVNPDDLAKCPVAPGETLVLIRNGKVVGRGRVGEIQAGWLPRAGGDRLVRFFPEGLPDSVALSKEFPFPDLGDRDFDLYVVGDNEVGVLEPQERRPAGMEEIRHMVASALSAGVFQPFDFQPANWVDGVPVLPESPEAAAWLVDRTEFAVLTVVVNEDFTLKVARCDPFFVRVQTADHIKPYFLRGALDYFLAVDGDCFMVMRSGRTETGVWGYSVYLLRPNALPERVYSDGSWST